MLFAKRIAGRTGRRASPEWFVYLALFFMTVLPRVAYLIVLRPAFDGTQWDIAETLLQSGVLGLDGLKTTSYEPAYPLFLSLARLVSRDNIRIIQTLQAAIDSIGAVYLYRLAKHLSGRERTAVFSAMLYALYPLLLDSTDEKLLDRIYTDMAFDEMRAHPLETLRVKLWNIAYSFWPRLVPSRVMTPNTRILFGADGRVQVTNSPKRPVLDDLAYSVSYGVVAVAALLGMWVRGFDMKRDAVLWCILITFVAIHAIYFPATQYRVSMEFVLLFYAAVGLDWCKHEEY